MFKWEEEIFKYLMEVLKSMKYNRKLKMYLNVLYYGKLVIFKLMFKWMRKNIIIVVLLYFVVIVVFLIIL